MAELSLAERNRMNPNHDAFWQARGFKKRPKDWKKRKIKIKAEETPGHNDADQLDPGHPAYWRARGLGGRPDGRIAKRSSCGP